MIQKKHAPQYTAKTIISSGSIQNKDGDGLGSGWQESNLIIERDGIEVYNSRTHDEPIEAFLCREFRFRHVTVTSSFSEVWE